MSINDLSPTERKALLAERRDLVQAGFTRADVHEVDAPTPGHIGTLIGRAER
ncbi:hypothetical protein ACFVYR_29010 [Streptomyces sp. NPDC058284]|uniref:hypothetical protein n=1 Tax=unclassified Streptomyces TaxID=2593676 RepID=UPI00364AC60E